MFVDVYLYDFHVSIRIREFLRLLDEIIAAKCARVCTYKYPLAVLQFHTEKCTMFRIALVINIFIGRICTYFVPFP